jgi:hypothetical protein
MSIDGSPVVIHSAAILPIPPACVTQTASQIQKPATSADSPTTDPMSGVNENMPFIAVVSSTMSFTGGSKRTLSSYATSRCSGVNGSTLGCGSPSR